MPAFIIEVPTLSYIPKFVPVGVLYYTQDTGNTYIGTGSSSPPNVQLVSAAGGTPAGFSGDIQYNNGGSFGGSAATIDANGNITLPNSTLYAADGAAHLPSIAFASSHETGLWNASGNLVFSVPASGTFYWHINGSARATLSDSELHLYTNIDIQSGSVLQWNADTGISRLGASSSVAIGNGTAGDYSGTLSLQRLEAINVSTTHTVFFADATDVRVALANNAPLGWTSTAEATNAMDTGLSRLGAGSVAIGSGAQGDWLGALTTKTITLTDNSGNSQFFINAGSDTLQCGYQTRFLWTNGNATGTADTGFSRLAPGSLALGNGAAGDFTGSLKLTTVQMAASSGAPTSAGTAGTAGQIIYFGGLVYFCSVTGVAGSATWNKLNMTAV